MIKNILLIRPNCTKDIKDHYITFPLGIGYVAAILRNEGYNIKVMDLTIENVNYDNVKERILEFAPDVICISALSYAYAQVKWLATYLKSFVDCKLVLGGHLSTHNYDLILKLTNIDICVLGEGELTIVDLMKNINSLDINNINSLENVKGIAFKIKYFPSHVNITEPRELIEDLDTLPFPAYDLFNLDEYTKLDDVYLSKRHVVKNKVHRKMAIEAGRGCPYNCNFCSKMFKKIRKRSVDDLISEIKHLQRNYGIDTFWFQDELLFSDKEYIFDFCDKIKPLNIGWYGNSRITSVDKDIIQKVKDNNCLEIAYGVESGSPVILNNMNKKITRTQIINILKTTIKIGLPMDMGLILGYEGENENTVSETVSMLKEVGFPGLKFRYITPYPGSILYNSCLRNGLITDEEKYLISLGDGTGAYRFRINFSQFTDERLKTILKEINDKVFKNYIVFLLKRPILLFRRIFQKDVMNPIYVIYNRIKRPTNYDLARKKKIA